MRFFILSLTALLMPIQVSSKATSLLPDDPLKNVDVVEISIVFGGALGTLEDESLFAAYPGLADELRPSVSQSLERALGRRSISVESGESAASMAEHSLTIGIYGRPVKVGKRKTPAATFLIELEFVEWTEASDSCESTVLFSSSYLSTVEPAEVASAILSTANRLLEQFAFNPAFCSGEISGGRECPSACTADPP